MKFKALIAALACGTFILGASSQAAFSKELLVACSGEMGSLQDRSSVYFTELGNKKLKEAGLDKDFQLKYFGIAQLGSDKDVQQKIKLGTVDVGVLASTLATVVPEYAVFELPFLVSDRQQASQIEKEVIWPIVAPASEKKGYKLIGVWENGFRQITNNKHPVNSTADLKGLKIRTPNSSWRLHMFKEWGSNPTPMAFNEVFLGLQTGVIDGQENPLTNIAAAKLQEVQKYLTMSNHVYSAMYIIVGPNHFAKLPEPVRQILLDSAAETGVWSAQEGEKLDKEVLAQLKAAGMEVNELQDRDSFVKASQPVYDAFVKDISGGKEIMEKILAVTGK